MGVAITVQLCGQVIDGNEQDIRFLLLTLLLTGSQKEQDATTENQNESLLYLLLHITFILVSFLHNPLIQYDLSYRVICATENRAASRYYIS
jgi:hypothetical protein